MKDLFRCLDEYSPELLQTISEAWNIILPKDEPLRMVVRLGEGMLIPGAVEEIVDGLSPSAREALAYLTANGGALPARILGMRYGELRRFGPARLRREQPWLSTASSLEELYYRGILYRAYGELGEYYGDLLIIPDQLLERIPPQAPRTLRDDVETGMPRDTPAAVGDALIEDLVAQIIHLRQQPIRQPASPLPTPELLERLDLGERLIGEAIPARLYLLWRLLVGQHLVEHDGRQWHLSQQARQWLGQTDAEQWLACYLTWRDDRHWDELFDLPSLICDRDGWHNPAWNARGRFCAILAALADGWIDLNSLIAGLRQHHPDYLRQDGDMDSWFIRDAATGEYLRGMGAWEAVEGALAMHLVTGPLHWLGITDLASGSNGDAQGLFRVTRAGRALIAETLPAATPSQGDAGEEEVVPLAKIDEHMVVTMGMANSRYQRYQMERLAEWQGQDCQQARYWLSENAVWQGQNAGITTEQILTFLQRVTGDHIPEAVERTLQAWGQRFGGAALHRVVLLETTDAAMMQRIRQVPDLARLLGQPLGQTRCLVAEEHMDRLVAELKKRNIWPRITR